MVLVILMVSPRFDAGLVNGFETAGNPPAFARLIFQRRSSERSRHLNCYNVIPDWTGRPAIVKSLNCGVLIAAQKPGGYFG
jgi:hypothetical protein